MAQLFISQKRLDAWTEQNKVSLAGDVMTLTDLGRSFRIRGAVRFLGVEGGDSDPHDLVGVVKDEQSLADMGAELIASSVIYVETAYKVENGFLGDPMPRE